MLQDLIRSAIVVSVSQAQRGRQATATTAVEPTTASVTPAAPATPVAGSDLDECSLANLAELADLAYRAGDRAFAEHCVRQLYALLDHEAKKAAVEDREAAITDWPPLNH